MQRLLGRIAVAAVCGVTATACSQYQVRLPDSDPFQPEGQDQAYETRVMHTYLWGLVQDPLTFTARCEGQALNDVVVESNYAMDLATVLTFGLWSPVEIGYRCRAPATEQDSFPEASDAQPESDNN